MFDRPAPELEAGAGRPVHLVPLDEAKPELAYRTFGDGQPIVVCDRAALVQRKARAMLEHLDFQPVETLLAEGVFARRAIER